MLICQVKSGGYYLSISYRTKPKLFSLRPDIIQTPARMTDLHFPHHECPSHWLVFLVCIKYALYIPIFTPTTWNSHFFLSLFSMFLCPSQTTKLFMTHSLSFPVHHVSDPWGCRCWWKQIDTLCGPMPDTVLLNDSPWIIPFIYTIIPCGKHWFLGGEQ